MKYFVKNNFKNYVSNTLNEEFLALKIMNKKKL